MSSPLKHEIGQKLCVTFTMKRGHKMPKLKVAPQPGLCLLQGMGHW